MKSRKTRTKNLCSVWPCQWRAEDPEVGVGRICEWSAEEIDQAAVLAMEDIGMLAPVRLLFRFCHKVKTKAFMGIGQVWKELFVLHSAHCYCCFFLPRGTNHPNVYYTRLRKYIWTDGKSYWIVCTNPVFPAGAGCPGRAPPAPRPSTWPPPAPPSPPASLHRCHANLLLYSMLLHHQLY